jgi:hypothetical protein
MAEQRGWWRLDITGARELSEADREHIGELIADGFTEGEIVADEPQEGEPKLRKVHVPGPDVCTLPPPVRTHNFQHATCALESCGHQYILISNPPDAGGTYWTSRVEWEQMIARTSRPHKEPSYERQRYIPKEWR